MYLKSNSSLQQTSTVHTEIEMTGGEKRNTTLNGNVFLNWQKTCEKVAFYSKS